MSDQDKAEPQKCPECGVKLSLPHQFDMHMSSHHPAQLVRPTEEQIRKRIEQIRQYADAGWMPSAEATNYALGELYWLLGEEPPEPMSALPSRLVADRERVARAIAEVDDEDHCFRRVDEWNALEQWERDAHPDDYPHSDLEDCAYWLKRADALFASAVLLSRAVVEAEALEAAAKNYERDGSAVGGEVREWLRAEADRIREEADHV